MKKIFYSLLLIFLMSNIVCAETIIYDNISTSNHKNLQIDDIANIDFINDYQYNIYINGFFYGTFEENENIVIPDNSTIIVSIIGNEINTNFEESYDVGKAFLTVGVMYFLGFGIVIILIIVGIRKIWRR